MDKSWIGCDLDGTLAHYDSWKGEYHIGAPIQKMVDRVINWLAEGKNVKIFTARVSETDPNGVKQDVKKIVESIEKWCYTHIGVVLPVTNIKDACMTELWDDRAVQVIKNTGERV